MRPGFVRSALYGLIGFVAVAVLAVVSMAAYVKGRSTWLNRQAQRLLPSYRRVIPAGTRRAEGAGWAAEHHVMLIQRGGSNVPQDMLLVGRAPVFSLCESSDIGIQVRYDTPGPAMDSPEDRVLDLQTAEWEGACL